MLLPTKIAHRPLHFGFLIGILFGSWNVLYSWLFPLADDTPTALLAFYGPIFRCSPFGLQRLLLQLAIQAEF
jgi:hypothetical protein